MEVHAHSHTPRKKWTHYFWEFFMLFLAVTLGFFVENQREHYIEKQRVKQYARSLIYDLGKDTANMHYILGRITTIIKTTDSLSQYLKVRQWREIRNIDLFVLSSLDRYPAYRWSRATLEQIKNSGSLRYFDELIVRLISSYDALSHHMDEDHRSDEDMASQATTLKNQLINADYPDELFNGLYADIDSMLMTKYFTDYSMNDSCSLLTRDPASLRIFLNEKLTLRRNLHGRVIELTGLISNARELIFMLKEKYHLK
ncbi:MAG: hypothetical protein ABUT20_28615 [Bacteroidota bacterium]